VREKEKSKISSSRTSRVTPFAALDHGTLQLFRDRVGARDGFYVIVVDASY
jgi:hypothetical protein